MVTTQDQTALFDHIRHAVKTVLRTSEFAVVLAVGCYVLFSAANALMNLLIGSLPANLTELNGATSMSCPSSRASSSFLTSAYGLTPRMVTDQNGTTTVEFYRSC